MNLHVWYNELSQFFSILSLMKVAIKKQNPRTYSIDARHPLCLHYLYFLSKADSATQIWSIGKTNVYVFKSKISMFPLKNPTI